MTLNDSPCPGRSDMGRLLGECAQCTRRDAGASAANVPPLVLLKTAGIEVCEGRRFHGYTIGAVEISTPPNYVGERIVSVISRRDAK